MIQTLHDLLDPGREVPPMDVQDVDVVRAQLLEGVLNRIVHRLDAVSYKTAVLPWLAALVVRRILGREDDLLADTALLHPLADELLGAFVLTTYMSAPAYTSYNGRTY